MTTALPAPAEDQALDQVFQAAVVGITGLPGGMVRARWQPILGKQPESTVDWCAIGVTNSTPEWTPSIAHKSDADGVEAPVDGADYLSRQEDLDVLATFYGPNAKSNAGLLRDGLAIPQNMELLEAQSIGFVETGPLRTMPELVNEQWRRRCDVVLYFRRTVERVYAVKDIALANINIIDDTGHVNQTIQVVPTTPDT